MFQRLPFARDQRWKLMTEFLARWYSPLSAGDGFSEDELRNAEDAIGCRLPLALREWYSLAGRRTDVWSQQDEFLSPEECQLVNGALVFYVENQSVVRWGIPLQTLAHNDPPVVVESADSPVRWIDENATTSEFALQMLVFSSKWSDGNRYWANGAADGKAVRLIEDNYARFAFPEWHWPDHPTNTYGTDDLIIETNGGGEHVWLWVWSRLEEEFRQFDRLMSNAVTRWEASSDADTWPYC